MSTILPASGKLPVYRFYVTYPVGSISYEVFPLNFLETLLVDELEEGQVFYRRKFNGSLFFGTNSLAIDEHGVSQNRKDDWLLIRDIEQNDPCARLDFLITKTVEGITTTYWEGYFSASDCKVDIDRCIYEVTPLTDDDYTGPLDEADTQWNILAVSPAVTTRALQGLIDVTYTRNRFLFDVIEYLADKIKTGVTVSSEFFNDATNYVTQETNHLTLLTIAQKSDIKRPTSSDPAPQALLSWNELMEILWGMFQVTWNYDVVTDTINIEHISWFSSSSGLDLRNQLMTEATNKYSYLKEVMPKYEKFLWMESSDMMFTGVPIWYNSKCVNPDPKTNIKETLLKVTTDLEYIIDNPNSISDDGFVILCNYVSGGNYYVLIEASAVGSEIRLNMHLSWTNLHNRYFRHNRVLIEGYLNDNLTTFWTAQKNIKQVDIYTQLCSEDYDPSDEITTELGETYLGGAKAKVQQSELKPTALLKISPLYGPLDNVATPIEDQKWIMIYEVTGASKSTFYATCSEATTIEITLHMYLTCVDAGSNTCDTANLDLVIALGATSGSLEIPWCEDSICVGAYHPDSSEAVVDGWIVDWIYDANSAC